MLKYDPTPEENTALQNDREVALGPGRWQREHRASATQSCNNHSTATALAQNPHAQKATPSCQSNLGLDFFFPPSLFFLSPQSPEASKAPFASHQDVFSLQGASLSNKCCLIPPFSPGAVTQIPNLHEKLAPENFRLDNQTGRLPKQGHDAGRGKMSQRSPGVWPS